MKSSRLPPLVTMVTAPMSLTYALSVVLVSSLPAGGTCPGITVDNPTFTETLATVIARSQTSQSVHCVTVARLTPADQIVISVLKMEVRFINIRPESDG